MENKRTGKIFVMLVAPCWSTIINRVTHFPHLMWAGFIWIILSCCCFLNKNKNKRSSSTDNSLLQILVDYIWLAAGATSWTWEITSSLWTASTCRSFAMMKLSACWRTSGSEWCWRWSTNCLLLVSIWSGQRAARNTKLLQGKFVGDLKINHLSEFCKKINMYSFLISLCA